MIKMRIFFLLAFLPAVSIWNCIWNPPNRGKEKLYDFLASPWNIFLQNNLMKYNILHCTSSLCLLLSMKFPTKNKKEKVYGKIASDCCSWNLTGCYRKMLYFSVKCFNKIICIISFWNQKSVLAICYTIH